MSAYSFDRGTTWHPTTLPFDACAPGGLGFERTSDPWVSIGPDGTVYAISISWNNIRDARNVVSAATSSDGGASWSRPVIVHHGPAKSGLGDDKESISADPLRAGVAYATWEVFELLPARERDDQHLFVQRVDAHGARARQISAPLWFARTVDGGTTWEEPRSIYDPGPGAITLSGQILIDPRTGTLYDFFNLSRDGRRSQEVVRSNDGGMTWSDPVRISRDFGFGVSHPNTGKPLRVGNEVPDAAIDPRNGDLYAVWEDSRFSGFRYDEVALSHSTDGGKTWSRPLRVNTPTGLPAFTPSVEVNPRGFVGVSYYDLREVGSATRTLPTDAWLVKLRGGRRIGEWKLAGPFDSMTAPNAGGFFLGDYEGLAISGNRFAAFFAVANDTRLGNRTDIVSVLR